MYPSPPAFAIGLGPTNPSLISSAKETLFFRRARISLALRLLVPTFSLPHAPPWVTPSASLQSGTFSYHSRCPLRRQSFDCQRTDRTRRGFGPLRKNLLGREFWKLSKIFTCKVVTYTLSLALPLSYRPEGLTGDKKLISQWTTRIRSFGIMLSPDHLRREISKSVSCYAFFEWWLLLSQHPDCLRNFTSSFALSMNLGTLTGGLGCFPFDVNGASPPSSNCRTLASGIRSLIEAVAFRQIRFFQCSTPRGNIRRKPESSFGENQLLPSSISFSLQPTTHPEMLHNLSVRTSIRISTNFILVMGSSPGFGSDTCDIHPP